MIDTNKLKSIDPKIILNALGMSFHKVGSSYMAEAVYRDERTASISIHLKGGQWLWKDFGDKGKGGSWIDLVIVVEQATKGEAIRWLNNIESASAEIAQENLLPRLLFVKRFDPHMQINLTPYFLVN